MGRNVNASVSKSDGEGFRLRYMHDGESFDANYTPKTADEWRWKRSNAGLEPSHGDVVDSQLADARHRPARSNSGATRRQTGPLVRSREKFCCRADGRWPSLANRLRVCLGTTRARRARALADRGRSGIKARPQEPAGAGRR
jgi:hypothetical protein